MKYLQLFCWTLHPRTADKIHGFFSPLSRGGVHIYIDIYLYGERYPVPDRATESSSAERCQRPDGISLSHHFLFRITFSSRCCSSARLVPSQNRPRHFSLPPSAVPRGARAQREQPARGDRLSRHRRFCAYFHLLCISMAELLRCC